MKRLAVLGSTGSIGTQTLDIVREFPELLSVSVLAAGTNVSLMEQQIREFKPKAAVMGDEEAAEKLKEAVKDTDVTVLSGMEGLIAAAEREDYDILLAAMVGMIGIRPTIAAIKAGKTIALANKETLVCAGHIIMPLAKEHGVKILPVDSEHSAVFQSMNGEDHGSVENIYLTCSGGPFRGRKKEELKDMTPADALKHPNWNMGSKITIDSATMVNKGLEIMEARWLFDMPYENIKVLVHPQSVVHSLVEYKDGAVIAQLGVPDMRLPIQYALFYPEREALRLPRKRLDLAEYASLTFEKPDRSNFPAIDLAVKAGKAGGLMPTVFNAANEEAVAHFLKGEIGFTRITELIEEAMEAALCNNVAGESESEADALYCHPERSERSERSRGIFSPDLDSILDCEKKTRGFVRDKL